MQILLVFILLQTNALSDYCPYRTRRTRPYLTRRTDRTVIVLADRTRHLPVPATRYTSAPKLNGYCQDVFCNVYANGILGGRHSPARPSSTAG
eukprot:scaffold526683_cov30-Prasinocladus_malaysianus.AAC.1